jgi:15-cis-phytoene synthase
MRQPSDYCEQVVREHDRDRFLATLFAPADKRGALFALYAFEIEVGRIPSLVSQPMAGEVRLQWWREVLLGERSGEAAASPLASALQAAIGIHGGLQPALQKFIEGVASDLYPNPIRSLEDLDTYAAQTGAAIIEGAMRILSGPLSEEGSALARHAAAAMLSMRWLRGGAAFVHHHIEGFLADSGVMRAHAQQHYERARALVPCVPEAAFPAMLPLALIPLQLKTLPDEPPQWRRQWIMWRAARRGRL